MSGNKIKEDGVRYTDAEKKRILGVWLSNKKNYTITKSITGVSRATLYKWTRNNPELLIDLGEGRTTNPLTRDGEPATLSDVKGLILNRIITLIPGEKDMQKLSLAYKTLDTAKESPGEKGLDEFYKQVEDILGKKNKKENDNGEKNVSNQGDRPQ